MSNIEIEDLGGGLRDFAGKVAALNAGDQSAKDLFAGIGIAADAFKGKNLDEDFLIVAEAINSMASPVERMGAAMAAMGEDDGPKLLGMMGKGREGIEALVQEFQKLQGGLSSTDLSKIEELNKEFAKSQIQLERFWKELLVGFAPAIKDLFR